MQVKMTDDDHDPTGGMDVMLRFDGRNDRIEKAFQTAGFELIHPRKSRASAVDCFQISIAKARESWDDTIALAAAFLTAHASTLALASESLTMELDFGLEQASNTFLRSVGFPPAFLRDLATFNIELVITVYS